MTELRRTDEEILALARAAWPLVRGDDGENARRAAALSRRSGGSVRVRRGRRLVVPVLVAASAIGSVALAATLWVAPARETDSAAPGASLGASSATHEAPPPPPLAPRPSATVAPSARAPGTSPKASAANAVGAAHRAPPARQTPRETGRSDASGWSAVDDALVRGDERAAERALIELATSTDPSTRSNAELGRAQLALARGDCESVRAIVGRLLAARADPAIIERARSLDERCRERAAPAPRSVEP